MRKVVMQGKSKTHSHEELWKLAADLEKYPEWVKFCKKVTITEIKEGETFYDVTTLLWIPLKIEHVITKLNPHEDIHFFIKLPGGGKMWHRFAFKQDGQHGLVVADISFDLGNKLYNATVGYVLEKRWENLLRHSFPGLDEIKRLQ
jgi:ribosome-associated toxin RatA of RatAB toxin-antitoxin module